MIRKDVTVAMRTRVETISPDASARAAADRLRERDVGALVVLEAWNGTERVAGIVTEADVVALVGEGASLDVPVASFMSSPVVSVAPATPLSEAAARMRESGVRRLPVLEDGDLVGLVTTADLAHYLPRHRLEVEWKGAPLGQRRKTLALGD